MVSLMPPCAEVANAPRGRPRCVNTPPRYHAGRDALVRRKIALFY